MKKRTIFGILCIVLAAVIAFTAIPILLKKANQRKMIVCVAAGIAKGEIITEEKLNMVEVGSYGLPDDVATMFSQVSGKYAQVDLVQGDYFLPAKVGTTAAADSSAFSVLGDGTVAVTMAVPSLSASIANTLRTGDIVSICQFKDGRTIHSETLHYVKILALTNSDGINLENVTAEQSPIAATVTFAVTEAQAQEIISIDHQAGVHMLLVCRADDPRANELLEIQKNVLGGQKK